MTTQARAALSLVVVGLADDDFDGAEAAHHSALERGDGYAGSDEAALGLEPSTLTPTLDPHFEPHPDSNAN